MKTPFSFLLFTLLLIPKILFGQAPDFGSASSFAVFTAVGAFTNDGATVVTGDIGTDAGSFTGFPPGVVIGEIHVADTEADNAAVDVLLAYGFLDALTCGTVIGVTMGSGQILTPDIYCSGGATTINGNLILDAQGDPDAIFIFQIDGALSTGTLTNIVLINGASLCNVYWQVNGEFTLGDGSVFRGNLVANGAIHLLEASSLFGRALSQAGAIDLHNNVVSIGLPAVASVIIADGPTSFCAGDSVTLSGNIDGVWSTGDTTTTIIVTTSGDYYVVNTTLCGSDTSNHIIVTVSPDLPPAIACPTDITVTCGQSTLPANTGTATGTDSCGGAPIVSFSDVTVAGICVQSYIIIRTWIATDAGGNTATCDQAITVIDNIPPSIICPGNITVICATLVPAPDISLVVASGACASTVVVTFTGDVVTNQTCANRYVVNRTYSATDVCGNIATCIQEITVFDNIPPSITCPGNVTVQCAANVPAVDPGVVVTADNCGGATTVTFESDIISSQTCINQFIIARTYVSTDECGNSAACVQTITVFDDTPPSIICPGNITVQCAAQVPVANPVGIVSADNCGGLAIVTFTGDIITNQTCANRFIVNRTYSSTDACGNLFDCIQTITVFDNTPPLITCPLNLTVQCASQVPAPNPVGIVTSENCLGGATVTFGGDVISNFVCVNQFLVNRTYLATDACGNTAACIQNITVFDNSPVTILCPVNITVQCASLVPAVNLNLQVTSGACGGLATVALLSEIISNQTCVNRFTVTRTYIATDVCAQSQTCVHIITVNDNLPPVITLPSGLIDGGTLEVQCFGQDPNWDLPVFDESSVTVIDNCGGNVTVTFNQESLDSGTCEEDGYINLYELVWTATDDCGNSNSASIFLVLTDTIAPVITGVPADITVNCDSIPELPLLVYATDECLCACIVVVQESTPADGCLDGQVLTRIWTATDRCGNSASVTQNITLIIDQTTTLTLLQPEMADMVNGSVIEYACSEGGIPGFYNLLGTASIIATGTCGNLVSLTFDNEITEANNCDFSGYIEQQVLRWEAVDLCGNEVSLTITVRLTDDVAPTLSGVPDIACVNDPSLRDVDAIDDCGESHVRFWDISIPNPCGPGTAFRRTYEAYDDCGNMVRDTAILIPNDLDSPDLEFVNPLLLDLDLGEVIILNCAAHELQLSPFGPEDVISHNECIGEVNVEFTETTMELGDCTDGGNVALMQLMWTATDVCGNLSTLSVIASVQDESNPVFVNLRSVVDLGCNDSLPDYVALDNCGLVVITTSDRYFYSDCASKYYIEREITATDPCGNSTLGFQTIYVGGSGPVIEGVEEEICDDLTIPVVTAFDECAGLFVDVTMYQDTLEEECRGMVIQRTWLAVSGCGDTTTITQLVVVGDTTAPEIHIPSYSILYRYIGLDKNIVFLSQVELIKQLNDLNENSIVVVDDCQDIIPVFTVVITTYEDCIAGLVEHRVYTWVATDVCGNSTSVVIIVDITDDVSPVIITIPSDTMIVCEPLPLVPVILTSDFAQPVTIDFTETISPVDASGIYIVIRTWTITDACGNVTIHVQQITWIPDSYLTCDIIVPQVVECNSHGVIITTDVTGGFGPFTYEWKIVGNKCFIQGGQGTPEITIYIGWDDVKIILNITDTFGCVTMCMYTLNCLEPGEIPMTIHSVFNTPESNSNEVHLVTPSVLNPDKGLYLKDLNLWPNPATGTINLSFESSVDEDVVFSFTNFLGQVVLSDKMDVREGLNTRKIDVEQLAGGSYLMEIKSDKEMLTKVIVILPRD